MAHFADDLGARVEVLVDAMTETHQARVVLLVLNARQELRNIVDGADLLEHRQHRLVGATVRRTPKRGHAGRDRGVRIGAGAAGQAHRRSAGVLLVIGMQDQQQVERLHGDRLEPVLLAGHCEEHVEQVGAVRQVVLRIDERLAEDVLVGGRGDCRDLGDDPVREDLAVARVMDVQRVVVEGRHRRDHGRHLRHRMGVVMEAVVEAQQRLVDHRVAHDAVLERIELELGRQLAVDQQVGDFEEGALLRQLLDGIAAVEEDAAIAVDVGDLRLAGGGRHETRIVGEQAVVFLQRRDVQYIGTDRGRIRLELRALAGGQVGQLKLACRCHRDIRVRDLLCSAWRPVEPGAGCHAAPMESRTETRVGGDGPAPVCGPV